MTPLDNPFDNPPATLSGPAPLPHPGRWPREPPGGGKIVSEKNGGRFPVSSLSIFRFPPAGARTNPTRVWGTDRRGKSGGGECQDEA